VSFKEKGDAMKRIAILTAAIGLMFHFGAAGAYAQQTSVKMGFSGTSAPSTIDLLQPNTSNNEDQLAGSGTLGSFTYRQVRAIPNYPASMAPSSCSGPNLIYVQEIPVDGGGVFRFHDGSLLYVALTEGTDCVNILTNVAHCSLVLKITGGTGRFKSAYGTLTFTETATAVLSDASGNPVLFGDTGVFMGSVSGVQMANGQNLPSVERRSR
jgi:hypothetical protein